jgi:alpha-mannosidase
MIRKPQYVIVGLLCWACGGFQSCSAQAQSLGDKPAPSHLTLKSKNILDDLASLASLPKPEWRFHAGDLNHGESPLLDDTSWPVAKTPSTLPAESTWLRSKIKVPKTLNGYDLTGTQIRFQLQLYANGTIT